MTYHVVDSTDGKHLGEVIDPLAEIIEFADGEVMAVSARITQEAACILANSNYIIRAERE